MSETQKQEKSIEEVIREEDALTNAIDHIRSGKGVLDTFPETRQYADEVEKLADKLENKAKPLRRKIIQAREEARRR